MNQENRPSTSLPNHVRIVEVGPRDGLQNEAQVIPLETKIELISRLGLAGLKTIEATAFVSPKWVPQMADNSKLMTTIKRLPGVSYPVLTPNVKGLVAAFAAGATEVAIFGAASESFSKKNINCSIVESIERFKPLAKIAHDSGIKLRGYVSCALGCPYEGPIQPNVVADLAASLFDLGCYEISLGDTIGIGTPLKTQQMIDAVSRKIPISTLAGHYHDTYGMAIANIYASLEMGMQVFDTSISGLGGCPYAKGASGNVATEDVVFMIHQLGIETGIDLDCLIQCSQWISNKLNRLPASKLALVHKNGHTERKT